MQQPCGRTFRAIDSAIDVMIAWRSFTTALCLSPSIGRLLRKASGIVMVVAFEWR